VSDQQIETDFDTECETSAMHCWLRDETVLVGLRNYYHPLKRPVPLSAESRAAMIDIRNELFVQVDEDEVVSFTITREECLDLARRFLNAYFTAGWPT
jgi:hypothetical protein